MRAYKPLGSVLNGSVVRESFHRGLTHVEAITGEMSRMCQELLALRCLGTTYTSDLELRDCKAPQQSSCQTTPAALVLFCLQDTLACLFQF